MAPGRRTSRRGSAISILPYLLLVLPIALPVAATLVSSATHLAIVGVLFGVSGWLLAGCIFLSMRASLIRARRTLEPYLEDESQDLEGAVTSAVANLTRLSFAAFGILHENRSGRARLDESLQRIVEATREQLGANAVELSLFDDLSGLWSKSFMVGEPRYSELQIMLSTQSGNDNRGIITLGDDTIVISELIRFAGTVFGTLRAEFEPGYTPTSIDQKVTELFATQTGIVLVNAQFTEEVLRLRRVSDESVQAKTGFLANLSHEIRGPLGIIINGVELGIEGLCGPITDEMKDTLRMIKESGDHLLDLVNDVLDYAKVEAGKVTPKPVAMDLKTLMADLMNVIRTQAQMKEHKLVLEPVDPSLCALCDKRHIRQILINLLTNAVKYTPERGTITVRVERYVSERVKISVIDTGIGIPESQRHKVFGAFERVDHKYAQAQVGTGLGMPLTLKLAEANGGTVDFDSEEGRGSTFWVVLPAAPTAEESDDERTAAGLHGPTQAGRGEKILLVEPDAEARHMVERYLEHQGFVVLRAGSGKELLRVLRDQPVDLCIVENDLPDLSGEEVVSVIRAHPRATTIPLILLSARAFVFDIERFLKLGVDRCLSKPFDLAELALTSRRLLDESQASGDHHHRPGA